LGLSAIKCGGEPPLPDCKNLNTITECCIKKIIAEFGNCKGYEVGCMIDLNRKKNDCHGDCMFNLNPKSKAF